MIKSRLHGFHVCLYMISFLQVPHSVSHLIPTDLEFPRWCEPPFGAVRPFLNASVGEVQEATLGVSEDWEQGGKEGPLQRIITDPGLEPTMLDPYWWGFQGGALVSYMFVGVFVEPNYYSLILGFVWISICIYVFFYLSVFCTYLFARNCRVHYLNYGGHHLVRCLLCD